MSIPKLILNKRGSYEIRWTEGRRSHRVSTRTRNLQQAQAAFAAFLCEQERDQGGESITVGKLIDDYILERLPHLADQDRPESILKILRAGLGMHTPEELSADVIARYSEARQTGKIIADSHRARSISGIAVGTLRRELSMLKAVINHGVRQRRVQPGVVPHIAVPAKPKAKDLVLTRAEVDTLIDCAKEVGRDAHLFVMIASETASRKGAIEGLRWEDVDFNGGLIHFGAQDTRRSTKRRVPVPISDALRPVLEQAKTSAAGDYVMEKKSYVAFCRVCAMAYKRTGNERFNQTTAHTLRHTWATHAAQAGVPIYQIAGVLGDTVATVTENYLHHCPDHLRSAINFRSASA